MLKQILSTTALLGLLFTGAAVAQSDTESDTQDQPAPAAQEDEAPAAQDNEAPADSALDLGTPIADGPALGERYSKQKFQDWDLACLKTEAETDPCSLLQIMRDNSDNPVAEISLFRIANGGQAKAGATVIVPLETLLTAQLTIAVDGGNGKRYNFSFCSPIGCVAQIGLTESDINAFKRGNKATVTIVPAPAPDQKINLDLSLKGFTAGYDAVDVVKQ